MQYCPKKCEQRENYPFLSDITLLLDRDKQSRNKQAS